ncbi:MAG TPA: MFS transporter [Bryobacteraceae bacterium]|nr:MFS transporter [Bryobacteraceae bacterium]
MSDQDWKAALNWCDRTRLTLPLGLTNRGHLPDWVRLRISSDLDKTAQRWQHLKAAYREAAGEFEAAGLECAVMKGFSHWPRFVDDVRHRWQGDLDLFFTESQVRPAFQTALGLGYVPIVEDDPHPMNHLPTLIRKTGWVWRGDYFDPAALMPLELHFAVWDRETERFGPMGLEQFWERRQPRCIDDLRFTAFHPADEVAVASLHLLRHLLRGSSRPSHVYEIAWMLDHGANCDAFWRCWRLLHHPSLRRLEAICFALAQRWFDCRMPDEARDEIALLPAEVNRWLDIYSGSPLSGFFSPNKDELWLHWSLLDSKRARLQVLRRRLFPQSLPPPADAVAISKEQITRRVRWRARWKYAAYAAARCRHHLRALLPTARGAIHWFGWSAGLGSQYWRFFFAEGFFDFGMFIFVFLYNLYLLQLGFREDFIGRVSGIMTAGSIAGTLLAAVALRRFGLRGTIQAAFGLTALVSAARAYSIRAPALLGLAAVAGVTTAAWPVAWAPAIAQLTTAKNRARGFSLISSAGIAIGVLGAQAAGHLPGWLARLHWASSSVQSYRESLLAGCVMVLLAMLALARVNLGSGQPAERKFRWPSPLVLRFLAAMLVWNLGTGAFNPFSNVFFARHVHLPIEQIGYVVSVSQIAQIAVILASPLVFRRFGLVRGIAGMQAATGLTLAGLAAASGPVWAAAGYVAYMMAQYMSEPGMFTFLMEAAPAGERASASALNFLVSFAGQALAAALAGQMLARFGYPPVLLAAGLICGAAALLFRFVLGDLKPADPLAL